MRRALANGTAGYISSELLVETNHEVLRHLEACGTCAATLADQLKLKTALRDAAASEIAPPGLDTRIRAGVRAGRSAASRTPWMLAIAAALIVALGVNEYKQVRDGRAQVAGLLDWGATDHTECALDGHYPPKPPTVKKMGEEDNMGPDYVRLVPVVQQAFPEYEVIEGHRCNVAGRRFPHVTVKRDGKMTSVSLLRKNPGEGFPRGRFLRAMEVSGIPLYADKKGALNVAGFETPGHLVFVISESGAEANLARAQAIAAPIRSVLSSIESGSALALLLVDSPQMLLSTPLPR